MKRVMVMVGALVLMTGPAAADWAEFGDWSAYSEVMGTGEDDRRICTASTGGDGDPVLAFTITDGDVGPPVGFPSATYSEQGYRGVAPRIEDGQPLTLLVDGTPVAEMEGFVDMMDAGIHTGKAAPDWSEAETVWNALRQGNAAEVRDAQTGEVFEEFSLAGSHAATLRMLDLCGLAD